jgi:hypothetical protein
VQDPAAPYRTSGICRRYHRQLCYRTGRKRGRGRAARLSMSVPIRDNSVTSSPHQPVFDRIITWSNEIHGHLREDESESCPFSARHDAFASIPSSLPLPLHIVHSRLPSQSRHDKESESESAHKEEKVSLPRDPIRLLRALILLLLPCPVPRGAKIHRPPVTPFR